MPHLYYGNSLQGKMEFCADCAKESLEEIILTTQTEIPLLNRVSALFGKRRPIEETEALDKAMSAIEKALKIYIPDFEYSPDRSGRFEAARQKAKELLPNILEAKRQYDSSLVHRLRDHWKTYVTGFLAGLLVDGGIYLTGTRVDLSSSHLTPGQFAGAVSFVYITVALFPLLGLAIADQEVIDKRCKPLYNEAAYNLAREMSRAFDSYNPAQN